MMCSLLSLKDTSIFNILIVKFVFEMYTFLLDIFFDPDFLNLYMPGLSFKNFHIIMKFVFSNYIV